MLFRTRSAAVFGIDANPIDVEVDLWGQQRPENNFVTVGMPDTAVKESRERIKSALVNSGLGYPAKCITVNLAPASVKKQGAGFDLPIAMGILGAMGRIPRADSHLISGELGLDGSIRPVRGILSVTACARDHGVKNMIVPRENGPEAAVVEGVNVYPVSHLGEVVDLFENPDKFKPFRRNGSAPSRSDEDVDFLDVRGQTTAKRSLTVAAAGSHNVLMIGPPGSGKTMLAKRLPGILPPLTFDEALETSKVHSVAGILPSDAGLLLERPFRSPHHTVSPAGLIGGGTGTPGPGEVSLGHNGVLFLDELPEFARSVLELLRQPLEDGSVTIARANMTLAFPAKFMLVGAMNPCPCGYYGDGTRECRCTGAIIQRYLGKISGPLLDRIDLHIEIPAVAYKELRGKDDGVSSSQMREQVLAAREIQRKRGFYNADIPHKFLRKLSALDDAGERTLELAVRRLGLSARAHDRILKVARTIADLSAQEKVSAKHVAEAVQYRSLDRSYWS